jgi:hypothetical protein
LLFDSPPLLATSNIFSLLHLSAAFRFRLLFYLK